MPKSLLLLLLLLLAAAAVGLVALEGAALPAVLQQLRHPHVCLLLGYSLSKDHEVMITELMHCSLLDVFKKFSPDRRMPLRRVMKSSRSASSAARAPCGRGTEIYVSSGPARCDLAVPRGAEEAELHPPGRCQTRTSSKSRRISPCCAPY